MYEVPIKYVFKGDRTAGRLFMRRGAVLMDMLEHFMSYRGLKQGVLRRWIRPDVLIECDCRFGLRTATITVIPQAAAIREEGAEKIVIRLIVAVSDGAGMRLHTAPTWEDDFAPATPLMGYYEPIPAGYWENTGAWYWERNYWKTGTATQGMTRHVVPQTQADYAQDRVRYYPRFDMSIWFSQSMPEYEFSADGRYKWAMPALLPWSEKDFVTSFSNAYGRLDETAPAGYRYLDTDSLSLIEIALSRFRQGKHDWWYKFIALRRGSHSYGFGEVGCVALQQTWNGAQRHVVLPTSGTVFRVRATDPVLFRLVMIRGERDVRSVPFYAKYASGLFPEYLRAGLYARSPEHGVYFYVYGGWAFTDGATGEMTIWLPLFFGSGDSGASALGYDFREDTDKRKWCMVLCRFVVPALVFAMTPDDEEERIKHETRMAVIATAEQFLPLMDMLARHSPEAFYEVTYHDNQIFADNEAILHHGHAGDYQANTVKYTVGGRLFHDGSPAYDLGDADIKIRYEQLHHVSNFLFSWWDWQADQKARFHYMGNAYVWVRHFGGIAWTPQGMFPQDMLWPPEVAGDVRTRPNVTHAGGGLFCCVCERTGEGVVAVHIGAPFDTAEREAGWRKIDLTTAAWAAEPGNRIEYVRPMLATAERVALLAIIREKTAQGGFRYRAALCDGSPDAPGATLLRPCGVIPAGRLEDGVSWDICVMMGGEGYDDYAEMLKRYPSPIAVQKLAVYNSRAELSRFARP